MGTKLKLFFIGFFISVTSGIIELIHYSTTSIVAPKLNFLIYITFFIRALSSGVLFLLFYRLWIYISAKISKKHIKKPKKKKKREMSVYILTIFFMILAISAVSTFWALYLRSNLDAILSLKPIRGGIYTYVIENFTIYAYFLTEVITIIPYLIAYKIGNSTMINIINKLSFFLLIATPLLNSLIGTWFFHKFRKEESTT